MALYEQTAAVLQSEGGRWERWTIDEVFDGRVRLLICEAQSSKAEEVVRDLGATLAPDRDPEADSRLHALAMAHELAPTDASWSDEEAVFIAEGQLTDLLRRRVRRQLPANRPLREGDVFWILLPRQEGFDVRSVARGRGLPAASEEVGMVVLDLTAAARQASKVTYGRAADARPPKPEA